MGIIARQGSLNAVYIVIGVLIGAISNVFIYPYFFRENLDYLGFLQLFIATAAVFVPFLTFGSVGIAVRYYPKLINEGKEKQLGFYVWVLPAIGIILFGAMLLFFGEDIINIFLKKNYVSQNIFLIALFLMTFFMTFFRSFSAMSIAKVKTDYVIFLNEVYIRIIILIGLFAVVFGYLTLYGFFIFHVIAYLSQLVLIIFYNRKEYFSSFDIPNSKDFFETLVYGIYSVFDNMASMVINKMDIFMIAIYLTLDKVAIYNLAFFMSIVINIPNRALMIVATPVISKSVTNGDFENVDLIYKKSSLTQLLLGGIIFLLIWVNFKNILAIANLPVEFAEAEWVFFYLGISKLVDLIGSVNGSILLATQYFKFNLYFNLFLLFFTIILNILFIPWLGIVGAAIATAFSLVIFNIMKGVFLYMKYKLQPFHKNTIPGLFILSLAFVTGYFLPEMNHPVIDLFVRSSLTILVFIPAILYFRISEDINEMFYKLVRRFFK